MEKGVFKGETAAEKKAYHLLMKEMGDVLLFRLEGTVLINPVSGQIPPEIRTWCNPGFRPAGFKHIEDRAWFRITDTEEEKMKGIGLGKHDQVGLDISGHQAGRGFIPSPFPDDLTETIGRKTHYFIHT